MFKVVPKPIVMAILPPATNLRLLGMDANVSDLARRISLPTLVSELFSLWFSTSICHKLRHHPVPRTLFIVRLI